jgi:hypothetical protein
VKEAGFKCHHARNLNQDPFVNTFGAILLYCCSNDNTTVGQFVDAQNNVLAFRGLCGSNCKVDGATLQS